MALGVFVFKLIVRLWFLFALWWIRLGIMFLLNMLVVALAFMNKLGRPADAGRVEKDLKCRLATAVGCTQIFFFCLLTPTSLPNICRAESSRCCVTGEWIPLPCSFQ